MRTWIRGSVLLAALLAAGNVAMAREPRANPACAQAGVAEASQQFAEVQDVRLAYVRCGAGAPTIVFEMGFGGNVEEWSDLFPRVALFAPSFAYSRPNRGRSEGEWAADADGMRTSEESARLLHDLLAAAQVPPPYLLVGVSLGGLYIQKFAQLYPAETAGLVLLDNRVATSLGECRAAGVAMCQPRPPDPEWSASIRTTFAGIEPSEAVAPSPEALGDLPVLVVTATRAESPDGEAFLATFRDAQVRFAARLRNGRQYMAAGATHDSLIHAESGPVGDQIRQFWERISATGRCDCRAHRAR